MPAPHSHPQETLTLQIPTSLDAQLAQAAVNRHQSKTDLVLEALTQYLSQDQQVATALAHLEHSLNQRLFALETKLTILERQVTVSHLARADRPPAQPPQPIAPSLEQDDDIEDEADEILWDFLPAEPSS